MKTEMRNFVIALMMMLTAVTAVVVAESGDVIQTDKVEDDKSLSHSDNDNRTKQMLYLSWRGVTRGRVARSRVGDERFTKHGMYVDQDDLKTHIRHMEMEAQDADTARRRTLRSLTDAQKNVLKATEEHAEVNKLWSDGGSPIEGELSDRIGASMTAVKEAIEGYEKAIQEAQTSGVEFLTPVTVDAHGKEAWALETNFENWTFSIEFELKIPNPSGKDLQVVRTYLTDSITDAYYREGLGITVDTDSNTSVRNFVFVSDPSLSNYISDDSSAFANTQHNTYSLEIKTPIWTFKELTERLPIFLDCLRDSNYPGMIAGKDSRPVVDRDCSAHVHIGFFGVRDGRQKAVNMVNTLKESPMGEPGQTTFFIRWMIAMLENYHRALPVLQQMMPTSRRGSPHFAATMKKTAARLTAALALAECATTVGESIDPKERKAEWGVLINHYKNIRGGVSDATLADFEKWQGETEVPVRMKKMRENALTRPGRDLYDLIQMQREGSSDDGEYGNVNLNSLLNHSTVEFRQQGGLLHSDRVLLWVGMLQSLCAVSMKGIPLTVSSQGAGRGPQGRLNALEDKEDVGKFLKNALVRTDGSDAMFSKMFHWVDSDMLTVPATHRTQAWKKIPLAFVDNSDADFKKKDEASVSGLGIMGLLGMAGALGVLKTIGVVAALAAAVALTVGCGVGGLIRLWGSGEHLSKGEMKGLLRLFSELAHRGDEGAGLLWMTKDNQLCADKQVAPPGKMETYKNAYTGVSSAWSRPSTIDIPTTCGALMVKGSMKGAQSKARDADNHLWILHTRFGTGGSDNTRNAHPHKIGSVTGIHNGVINNDLQVMDLMPDVWTKKNAVDLDGLEVDTRAIWSVLDQHGDSSNESVQMLGDLVSGSMRIAWLDEREMQEGYPARVHFWSNTDDLWFGETVKGNIVFGSTERILKRTFGNVLVKTWEAKTGHHYIVDWQHGVLDLGQVGYEIGSHNDPDAWRYAKSVRAASPGIPVFPKSTKTVTTPQKTVTNPQPHQHNKLAGATYKPKVATKKEATNAPLPTCCICEDGDRLSLSWPRCTQCGLDMDDLCVDTCSSPSPVAVDNDAEGMDSLFADAVSSQKPVEMALDPDIAEMSIGDYVAEANMTNEELDLLDAYIEADLLGG